MEPKQIRLTSALSTMRAVGANEFGKAIILGCENPGENGRPLTEVQKCDVAAMILMCYADFILDVSEGLEGDALIDSAARKGPLYSMDETRKLIDKAVRERRESDAR